MVEQVLLVLRIAFVILLYLFIWRVVRLSLRDVRRGHESMVLSPGAAASAGLTPLPVAPAPGTDGSGRLVVVRSPVYPPGTVVVLEHDVVFGRAEDADAVLDGDTTASSRHARVFRRGSQVYVEDLSSTNGTYVNGRRLAAERALRSGDVVVVGATEMRFEQAA
jgi:hypothetical protein